MVKQPPDNAGDIRDVSSIPGQKDSREEGLPTPVFLPGDPMDRGAWWAIVHRVTKSRT